MTAPQDVILSEWFQRLQNICLQHILKQSTPFPTKPNACVWLVWTFLAALLNRNTYACCLFPSPTLHPPLQKGFHYTLNHGGLIKIKLLILSYLQQSFLDECFLLQYPSAHTDIEVSLVVQRPSAKFPGTQSSHHLSNVISIFRATFGPHQVSEHPPLA